MTRFANVLKHGAELSPLAADALCNGDPGGLEAELGAGDGVLPPDVDRSPTLPSLGRWEYKVISVSEVGGFATAKGTVGRIQETLDQMAADGWELVNTNG